jgi:hypothetical protein
MTFRFYRILGCDTVWPGNNMSSSQMKVLSTDRGKSQLVGGRLGCDAEESETEVCYSSEQQSGQQQIVTRRSCAFIKFLS